MLDTNTLILFSGASLLLLVVPGPAVLYIVARAVEQGRLAGLTAVAGVHFGTMFHIAAAGLGLSAVLMSSALAFNVVKYLGALYLIYLGLRTMLGRHTAERPTPRGAGCLGIRLAPPAGSTAAESGRGGGITPP